MNQRDHAVAERRSSHMLDLALETRRFIKVQELAECCGVTPKTVYRHIEKGALKAVYIGPFDVVRIPIEEARRYVHSVPKNGNGHDYTD